MLKQKMIESQRVSSVLRPVCAHPAWVEVDMAQFKRNLASIRKRIGQSLFCLPVKANAYGHGLSQMAKAAASAGVDSLGVSCLKEAIELRLAGVSIPILIFGAIHEGQVTDLIDFDLEFTISSKYKALMVAQKRSSGKKPCKVHVEVDTGMRRTGVRPESVWDLLSLIDGLDGFEIVGLYSHLATADRPNDRVAQQQIAQFQTLAEKAQKRGLVCHLANSGGVAYYPDSYFDMVRPGLLSYGYFPDGAADPEGEIFPCLSLKANISYFKVVGSGEGISYGHAYRTRSATRIVTVPIGYGDGYRRSLSSNARVLIRGESFPIAGMICMDQFMVDVGKREVYVGDEAVLIGKQGKEEITLWELSRLAESIPHEMLCALNDRLVRIYEQNPIPIQSLSF